MLHQIMKKKSKNKDPFIQARWSLSGMHGTWSEYWIWAEKEEYLFVEAHKRLQMGYNAILEDHRTGKVKEIKLKEKPSKRRK